MEPEGCPGAVGVGGLRLACQSARGSGERIGPYSPCLRLDDHQLGLPARRALPDPPRRSRIAGGDGSGNPTGAANAIIRILSAPGPLDPFALRRIVVDESMRWSEQNYARLKQFGYRCDSY